LDLIWLFVIWFLIWGFDLNHFLQMICDLYLWFDLWFAHHCYTVVAQMKPRLAGLYWLFLKTGKRSHSPTSRFPSSPTPDASGQLLNRFRAQGHCGMCRKNNVWQTNVRPRRDPDTMPHIADADSCRLTKLDGGLQWLHTADKKLLLIGWHHMAHRNTRNIASSLR